jgi:uncharacterized phiE125 gp8 family phage protein
MGYCALRVISGPAIEPVTLADAKAHLRLDHDSDDGLVASYTAVARSQAEQFLNRALITQTLQFTLSPSQPPMLRLNALINPIIFVAPLSWPALARQPITLPMSPVQAVQSVTQRSRDGTLITLTAGPDFDVDTTNEPGRVTLRNAQQTVGSDLTITYVAGYGDTIAAVPVLIQHAVKLLLTALYEHRGDDQDNGTRAAEMLMYPYRMVGFA